MSYTRTDVTYSFGFTNGSSGIGGSVTVNVNDWSSVFTEAEVDSAVTAYLDSLSSKSGVSITSSSKIANAVESGSF